MASKTEMEDENERDDFPAVTLDDLLNLSKYDTVLQVKPSRANDEGKAGLGLFTTIAIPKGEIFLEYTGQVIDFAQARLRKDRSYMKLVSINRHIDAIDETKSSKARFINDHVDKSKHNCKFS